MGTRGKQPYRGGRPIHQNRHPSHRIESFLNISEDESRGEIPDEGQYSDDEEQYARGEAEDFQAPDTRTTEPMNGGSAPGNRDPLLSEQEFSPARQVSPHVRPVNEQAFREMSMVEMARYMWKFNEVRDAIQDFDKELFVKIANIIFE